MRALFAALLILANVVLPSAHACTKLMWDTEQFGVFIARSEDFDFDTMPTVEVRHQGQKYQSPGDVLKGAKWTSRYSSIMVTMLGVTAVEGFNEKGLSVSALTLDEDSDELVSKKDQDDLINILMIPYVLDNFATVSEAIDGLQKLRIYRADMNETTKFDGHYALQDRAGDSAVIEIVNGVFKAYHSENYNVLANSPTYDQHLANWELAKPKSRSDIIGTFPLPGNTSSKHRFIRGKYMLEAIPAPTSVINGILKINSALPTVPVSVVGKVVDGRPISSATQYTATYNLEEKILHIRYQYDDTFTQFAVDFNQLNDGNNYVLDAAKPDLAGDVTAKFTKKPGVMALYRQ